MSTRDPPSPADGPARDVFATPRHGQHGQRKHTRSLVPPMSLSLALSFAARRAIKHTAKGARGRKKDGAGVDYLNQLLEDECPGPDSPGQFKPESVQALGVGSRGGGASENVGVLATSPNMA